MNRSVRLGITNGDLMLIVAGEEVPAGAAKVDLREAMFWLKAAVPPAASSVVLHSLSQIADTLGYGFHASRSFDDLDWVMSALESALKDRRLQAYRVSSTEGGGKGTAPTPQPEPQPETPPTPVNPIVEPVSLVVLVKKIAKNPATNADEPYTKPKRQPVTLRTDTAFDGTATFTCDKPDKVKFFSADKEGTEIKFDGTANVFKPNAAPAWAPKGATISSGVTVYAEGAAPSAGLDDVTIKLALSGGSKPTGPDDKATITSVELTLELYQSRISGADPVVLPPADKVFRGRFLHVRNAKRDIERAKIVVKQAKPAAFAGKLELVVTGSVKLYAAEKRPTGSPPPAEASIAAPVVLENSGLAAGKTYWVEATGPSGALRDVTFTLGAQGVDPQGDLGKMTNVEVRFDKSPRQKWGYDDLDDADAEFHHLSVKKNDTTVALCNVKGPITGAAAPTGVFFFVCETASIADATQPASLTPSFDLTISGKDKDKDATFLRARINDRNGPICASLKVHVYKLKELSVTVLKAYDSTSAGTTLTRPRFDVEAAETVLNEWYKPAVVKIDLKDHSATGDAVDIAYDKNGNGKLDLEPAGTSDEAKAINDAFNPTGQKVVIVKDLAWIYFLKTAAAIDDTSITLKDAYSGYMKFIGVGNTYTLGSGATAESIKVKSKTGTTIELDVKLTKAHPTTDGLIWPLSGLSGNPIFVAEQTKTESKERETIGHENGHSLLAWLDLEASDDLMHYSSGRTDTKVRYKELPRKYDAGNEVQWDKVVR